MGVTISKRQYKNFGECIFLDNGTVTLGATLDVGPRANTAHGRLTADTDFGSLQR